MFIWKCYYLNFVTVGFPHIFSVNSSLAEMSIIVEFFYHLRVIKNLVLAKLIINNNDVLTRFEFTSVFGSMEKNMKKIHNIQNKINNLHTCYICAEINYSVMCTE